MTKIELRRKLIAQNVPVDAYSLEGGLPNEAYCLGKTVGRWETYYSERGQKTSLQVFESEDEACCYFYQWVTDSLKRL